METALIDTKEIEQGISKISQDAMVMTVTDMNSYKQAGMVLLAFKEMDQSIKSYFKTLKESAHKAWKAICERENEELAKLVPGMNHLNKVMIVYKIEEDRKRREEEERLRQEALRAEEERRLQDALQAEQEGNQDEAETILETPIYVPPPIVETQAPKIDGLGMQTTWGWKITNEALIPRVYLKIDEIKINGIVRALKDKTNIAGIEVYPEQSIRRVRGK